MRNFVPQCVPRFLHQRVKSYLAPRQDSMHGKIEVIMLILINQFPWKQIKFICAKFTNSSKTRYWSLSTKNIWLYNTVVRKSNYEKHVHDSKKHIVAGRTSDCSTRNIIKTFLLCACSSVRLSFLSRWFIWMLYK